MTSVFPSKMWLSASVVFDSMLVFSSESFVSICSMTSIFVRIRAAIALSMHSEDFASLWSMASLSLGLFMSPPCTMVYGICTFMCIFFFLKVLSSLSQISHWMGTSGFDPFSFVIIGRYLTISSYSSSDFMLWPSSKWLRILLNLFFPQILHVGMLRSTSWTIFICLFFNLLELSFFMQMSQLILFMAASGNNLFSLAFLGKFVDTISSYLFRDVILWQSNRCSSRLTKSFFSQSLHFASVKVSFDNRFLPLLTFFISHLHLWAASTCASKSLNSEACRSQNGHLRFVMPGCFSLRCTIMFRAVCAAVW